MGGVYTMQALHFGDFCPSIPKIEIEEESGDEKQVDPRRRGRAKGAAGG